MSWFRISTMAALAASVLGGCASERDPIDRTQPNGVLKAFFIGDDFTTTEDDPEFYKRGTIIDVGYGAAQDGLFVSSYAMPVTRIRWEITENYINARLAYEKIEGTDGKGETVEGVEHKAIEDGQIVASYAIQSHYDIKRAYNSTTGEEYNVIEENTSDRPWYQREYMHVDWSRNLMTDAYEFDTLAQIGIYGNISYEPVAFSVLDPASADAPVFDIPAGYFDVTNKVFATPGMIDLSSLGWGIDKFPACWLPGDFLGGTAPYGNCNPVELTIRESFRRVEDTDYQPIHWDGIRFQAAGVFNYEATRYGYERNYGLVDNQWFRFAQLYNLWQRSHYYANPETMEDWIPCATKETTVDPTGDYMADANRDEDGNGTADECEAVTAASGYAGSQCDIFTAKCTLPYRARQLRQIPWYVQIDTKDEDMFVATDWATQEWDIALRTSIQIARLVECRRTGGTDCDAQYPMWRGQQDDTDDASELLREKMACQRRAGWTAAECTALFDEKFNKLVNERGADYNTDGIAAILNQDNVLALCHNPVTEADHPLCGEAGLAPRIGDLRYNAVIIIQKPESPSSWGIMVDGSDPVTGEKVASAITVFGHVTDLASQQLVDLVRYVNGEIPTSDITNGEYIKDWAQAAKLGAKGLPTLSKDDVNRRLAAAARMKPEAFRTMTANGMPAAVRTAIAPIEAKVKDIAAYAGAASTSQAEVMQRMNAARGTATEAALLNGPMLQLAGLSSTFAGVAGSTSDAVSPLALNNPKVAEQLRQMRDIGLAKRGVCILDEAPEPTSSTALADILARKFPKGENETAQAAKERYESMWRYIRRRYQYAVIGHEMGHSMGHRHNFVSSYGALFFRPQYWQLRTLNGTVTTECTDAVNDGSSCVGPRFFDPVTDTEKDQIIEMYMHSSIMDYAGDLSQDLIGLGVWDFFATRMFYGDNAAVYTNPDYAAGTKIGVGITNATDTFGGMLGIKYSQKQAGYVTAFHYSQLQKNYNVINNCYTVDPQPPAWWDESVDGVWDVSLDGHYITIDGGATYTRCRQQEVDYVAWKDLKQPTSAQVGAGGYYMGGPSVDAEGRTRVPYGFATDHWADLGNVSVYRHDLGADTYELAMFLISTMENRHIFDNFRRYRTSFSVRGSAGRAFERYNEKMLGIATGLGFYANIYENFGLNSGYSFETLWPYIVDLEVKDHMLAASVIFDHFTRQLSRPEHGEHYYREGLLDDGVLRAAEDADGNAGETSLIVPNGSTGYLRDIGFGGAPLENALSDYNGDYDSEYTLNAGSYYNKINTAILLSESEDRFISQSRGDFYDARFRSVGLADVFGDGWRRIIANSLVGDRSVLAPHVATNAAGVPLTASDDPNDPNGDMYPRQPIAWTSWWPTEGPEVCFPSNGRNVCKNYDGTPIDPATPAYMAPIDPQVGWEVQKFMIAWTLAYIPSNMHSEWIDMMRIYRLGQSSDPAFEQRIEWQDPNSGQIYYAHTYGKECLFGTGETYADCVGSGGKWVEKGIAARVLEYANELTSKGYVLDTVNYVGGNALSCPFDGFNDKCRAMFVRQPDGSGVIVSDPGISSLTPTGMIGPAKPTCDLNVDPTCEPLQKFDNRWAFELEAYKSVPDYLWQAVYDFGMAEPAQLGIY